MERRNRQHGKPGSPIPSFAFIGNMGSGKNTYADCLKDRVEKEFGVAMHRPAISEKINEIAKDLFGMKEKDRPLLQGIGSKMKDLDKRVWARYLVKDIKSRKRLPFAIDGLRFREDIEILKESFPDLIVIKVKADEKQRLEAYRREYGRYPTKEELGNITEKMIADLPSDMVLFNNYTHKELDRQIGEITDAIRNGTVADLLKKDTV